jgi:hypothetical protein
VICSGDVDCGDVDDVNVGNLTFSPIQTLTITPRLRPARGWSNLKCRPPEPTLRRFSERGSSSRGSSTESNGGSRRGGAWLWRQFWAAQFEDVAGWELEFCGVIGCCGCFHMYGRGENLVLRS